MIGIASFAITFVAIMHWARLERQWKTRRLNGAADLPDDDPVVNAYLWEGPLPDFPDYCVVCDGPCALDDAAVGFRGR